MFAFSLSIQHNSLQHPYVSEPLVDLINQVLFFLCVQEKERERRTKKKRGLILVCVQHLPIEYLFNSITYHLKKRRQLKVLNQTHIHTFKSHWTLPLLADHRRAWLTPSHAYMHTQSLTPQENHEMRTYLCAIHVSYPIFFPCISLFFPIFSSLF